MCHGEPSHASMVTADKALCFLSTHQHDKILDVHGVENAYDCHAHPVFSMEIILRRPPLHFIQTMQL